MNLLMADDDAHDVQLVRIALKDCERNYFFDSVTNGEELLENLSQRLSAGSSMPDIILLDLNMPVMDGKTALKCLKENILFKDLKVYIFSTSENPSEIRECLRSGAHRYIVKPFDFGDLVSIMTEIRNEAFDASFDENC